MTDRSLNGSNPGNRHSAPRKGFRTRELSQEVDTSDKDSSGNDQEGSDNDPLLGDDKPGSSQWIPSISVPHPQRQPAPSDDVLPPTDVRRQAAGFDVDVEGSCASSSFKESTLSSTFEEQDQLLPLRSVNKVSSSFYRWDHEDVFQVLRARRASMSSEEVAFSSESRSQKLLAVFVVVSLYIMMYVIGGLVYYVLEHNGYTLGYPGYLNSTSPHFAHSTDNPARNWRG